MELVFVERHNKMQHLLEKGTPNHQNTVKQDIFIPFRALTQIQDNEPQVINRQFQQNPF